MTLVAAVTQRLAAVRARIADAGKDPASVTVVAVTKGFGPEAVRAALGAGVVDIAESYAQELVAKAATLSAGGPVADLRWHFVGRLQTNKIARLAPLVQLWQSVDRPEVVRHLARRAPRAQVLVQVDVTGGSGRGGCAPGEVPTLVAEARHGGLEVSGLMAVGQAGPPEGSRPGFRSLATLADDLGLAERSMGMSGDLEVAVEEGSTMVRVGQALFGPRPASAADEHAARRSHN